MRGLLTHGVALGRDVLLELTGSLSQQSRQSFQAANEEVRVHWQWVWSRVTSKDTVTAEPPIPWPDN